MASKKNTYKQKKAPKRQASSQKRDSNFQINVQFYKDRRFKLSLGFLLLFSSLTLFLSIVSFLFSGKADQSVVESLGFGSLINSGLEVENWLGLIGAWISHLFIYEWFGIPSILLSPLLFFVGFEIVFRKTILPMNPTISTMLFAMLWFSILLGYIVLVSESHTNLAFICGKIGYQSAFVLNSFVGWGTVFFLVLSLAVFVVYFFDLSQVLGFKKKVQTTLGNVVENTRDAVTNNKPSKEEEEEEEEDPQTTPNTTLPATQKRKEPAKPSEKTETSQEKSRKEDQQWDIVPATPNQLSVQKDAKSPQELQLSIEDTSQVQEASLVNIPDQSDNTPTVSVEDMDFYDPKLDLGNYQKPTLELLNNTGSQKVRVTKEELEENKDKIVETLSNFKIGIASIKATIGPTVTLYEIVPDAGVKISRIRNLEDDIALSLAALGIRIIAPIPGKGTIGIEVPNKNREMVSIHSVLDSEQFVDTNKALPIALGRTISNDVFITDLTKMPHLLMAGATGQGKSVGINTILTSILYKKHPAEVKFVMIDPKQVELSLFNKIERHFLATLPDAEDSIVTDTTKAVHVLSSLVTEMELRYKLLKDAHTRNIKEYNNKFVRRRLNPEKGHRFMPYIVLVIDELADLMMTAGKEIEMPIARLAQKARAIGIHLILATQRPSVDVITGIIKANFPARLSFRVFSKIDSRTILDTGGADQLVGMGDMLLSNGSEIIRLQCAYVDTEEVEKICEHIGEQKGYETPYLLPEYETEENEIGKVDLAQRDDMFEAAARLLITHQQGSTSLIQRKLSLGYNRAGRIIDQLEAAGIVGPFEGSKARQVLIQDEYTLEQLLNSLGK
ncbi:DNA translocase FtsK 4TM domain-containing protein [Rapidithrix thailandica]|uniref:DNA translocase FtsK 4TM domain-containing protein n=1 Tax=Rapidithrix thailandica TaxID=413964 RepID=A0AAW9SFY6_9BACT